MISRTPLFAVVFIAIAASGCAKGPRDKLQGKWIGDRIENVSAEQVARATGWVKGATMEFAGDKMTMTIPAEQPRTGAFKVAKAEGTKMTLAVTRGEGHDQVDEASFTMPDEKTIRWDIGEGREIVMLRTQ